MIELGLCRAVLCLAPGSHDLPVAPHVRRLPGSPFGASSELYGSPQAEFDIPYGNLGQNGPYAQLAQRYGAQYGYDPAALAKIAVDQRTNACAAPDAVFYGRPITVDDVLASPMVAAPLHLLEIVMPCHGGAAILVTDAELARRARHRPVWIKGFGERVDHKTPTYAADLLDAPVRHAAERAFTMAGLDRGDVDIVSVYDCYTITVLLTLEAAGFCAPGTGMTFVREHDLTYRGDFPVNTWGGQLSFGQAGVAGGMHHVCDASRQLRGQAGDAQVRDCHRAFVSGNGGILGEQNALVLVGD
jgi:acetyl-CoA acetyltransferase